MDEHALLESLNDEAQQRFRTHFGRRPRNDMQVPPPPRRPTAPANAPCANAPCANAPYANTLLCLALARSCNLRLVPATYPSACTLAYRL